MQEPAVLANMATILCKDITMDAPKQVTNRTLELTNRYAMLMIGNDDNDEEDVRFFLRQQRKRSRPTPMPESMTVKSKLNATQQPAAEKMQTQQRTNDEDDILPPFKLIKLEKQPTTSAAARTPLPRLNLLKLFPEWQFENYLHMRRHTYVHNLHSMYNMLMRAVHNVTPTTVHALGVWKLTTDEHFEEIARRFKYTIKDCQQHIRRFWHIVSENYERFIKWPNTENAQQRTLHGFEAHRQLSVFHQLFGIVATKRLDIFLACEDTEVPVILQIVCNGQQKIIDCFVELVEDYTFDSSPIGQTLAYNSQTLPAGCYLIGNHTFPLRSYLMRPIGTECFSKDSVFNEMLTPVFKFAEHVLDMLAKRFNILYALEARDLLEARQIVEAICALHNLCIHSDDDYLDDNPNIGEFNWANANKDDANEQQGSEKDAKGLAKRNQLIDRVVGLA